ncbi:MAG: response regulator [bacterium]|nr:response regulator [bacterium]
MELLKDFGSKNFAEQMGILAQIEGGNRTEYFPQMFHLYNVLIGDKTVDAMLEHTLRDMLGKNREEVVKKIVEGTPKEKKLCLQIAGNKNLLSAVTSIKNLVRSETDMEVLIGAFIAMSEIKDSAFLELFRENMRHSNEIIAGISIEMIGAYHDTSAENELENIIDESEAEGNYETCTVETADAIESLAQMSDDESIGFLATKTHHRNPMARRIIHEELEKLGPRILPFLAKVFTEAAPDPKIMVSGIFGRMGLKEGGDILVTVLDKKLGDNPNVRSAIYEALGYIHSMKGLVCLVDALSEQDLQVLMAVVTSLELQVNPGVIMKMKEILSKKGTHAESLIQAVVGARAVDIFENLYRMESPSSKLIDALLKCNDAETLDIFAKVLKNLPGDNAKRDLEKLTNQQIKKENRRILAVDDSITMRLFYRKIISLLGMETTVAEHGRQALDIIGKADTPFDLIITDLNMPVMDGLEFTQNVRMDPVYDNTPILMGTTESDSSQVELARKNGVNDFLFKPIKPDELKLKLIRNL